MPWLERDRVAPVQTPPELTNEQRKAASTKAVANRRRRSEIKAQLRSRELTWSQVVALAQTDEVAASLKVADVLRCIPGIGPRRLEKHMARAQVSATRRLRGLGPRQLEILNQYLDK